MEIQSHFLWYEQNIYNRRLSITFLKIAPSYVLNAGPMRAQSAEQLKRVQMSC